MPAAPVSAMCGRSTRQAGVDQQRHRFAVLGHARHVAQRLVLVLPPRPQPHALGVGGLHVGQRPQVQIAGRAVDDDGVARIGDAGGVVDLADRRNAERARDDGDMRMRAALLEHQPAQALAVVIEQRRRTHRAGDQDGILRQVLARRRVIAAGELTHQAGWRDRRGRAAARADTDRSAAACGRGCPTARVRPRPPRSGPSSPLLRACEPSRGRGRTCDRLRERRDVRRPPPRRRARAARRDGCAMSRPPLRDASIPSECRRRCNW